MKTTVTTRTLVGHSNWLTPNYRSRLTDPVAYNAALATVLGRDDANKAANDRQPQYRRLSLGHVAHLLERAGRAAADIIAANPAPAPATSDRNKALAARGDAVVSTYCRDLDLFEGRHFDDLDLQLSGEILARARMKTQRLEGTSSVGLALLDMHLRDAVDAIKPLLAVQSELLEAA